MISIGKFTNGEGFIKGQKTVKELTPELINDDWFEMPKTSGRYNFILKAKREGNTISEGYTEAEINDYIQSLKDKKITKLKESLKAQVKEVFFDLDNTKTRNQLVTIAKNRFTTKKAEINALTTIEEVNNYQLT